MADRPIDRSEDEHGNPKCCLATEGGICRHHKNTEEWRITDEPIFPRMKHPGWRNDVTTGDANRAPTHITRSGAMAVVDAAIAARQRRAGMSETDISMSRARRNLLRALAA